MKMQLYDRFSFTDMQRLDGVMWRGKKSSSRQEVMRFMFWDKEKKETAKVVKAARLNKQRKERHLQKIKKNRKHKEGMRETKINS